MSTLTIEDKGIIFKSEQGSNGSQKLSIEFSFGAEIQSSSVESLILMLNPDRETLERILTERYSEAA